MTLISKIHAAIEKSRESGDCAVSEDPGRLSITATMSSGALDAWEAVCRALSDWLQFDFQDSSHDSICPKDGREGEQHRLTLWFDSAAVDGVHVFTKEGWRSLLLDEAVINTASVIRLAFESDGFETQGFKVEPWTSQPELRTCPEPAKRKRENGPRRHVRNESPGLRSPLRIEPWISTRPPPSESDAYQVWMDVASQEIAKSLPNELYMDDGPKVALTGQPSRRLEIGSFQTLHCLFDTLQDVARWIYLEGDDVEVRHTFLASELSREWPLDSTFCAGLIGRLASAFSSAKLLYKAHLRASSKDTIKSLSDLRKTLADEVQKVIQQTRDLSASVWRDIAVVIGIVGFRFAIYGSRVDETNVGMHFVIIYIVIGIYVGVSYWMTISTNRKFTKILEDTRLAWRSKLYSFLDDADYRTLADKPVTDSIDAYKEAQRRTSIIVGCVILLLVLLIMFEYGLLGDIFCRAVAYLNA